MRPTPSQTIGPFFGFALPREELRSLAPPDAADVLTLRGTVYDAAGEPVRDALIELLQADASGLVPRSPLELPRANPPGFQSFGRCATDDAGRYEFDTVRPGHADGLGTQQAPHLSLVLFARGLLNKLLTRVYLPQEPANALDPLLSALPDDLRNTLVAQRDGAALRHDIHLSGPRETVFLAF